MRPCSTTLRSYANFEECHLRASETWSEVMIQHSLQHSFGRETNKARYWRSARAGFPRDTGAVRAWFPSEQGSRAILAQCAHGSPLSPRFSPANVSYCAESKRSGSGVIRLKNKKCDSVVSVIGLPKGQSITRISAHTQVGSSTRSLPKANSKSLEYREECGLDSYNTASWRRDGTMLLDTGAVRA